MKVKFLKSADRSAKNKDIECIRTKNERAITRLYELYRDEFICFFVKEYDINREDVAEIYQESFIALYQNIAKGTQITSSLKTYLFQIGKHKTWNRFRDTKPMEEVRASMSDIESEEPQIAQEITYEVVSAMEEPCSQLLSFFYWERKSMDEIASIMGYKNGKVAKTRKSICMSRLKERLLARFKEEDLM